MRPELSEIELLRAIVQLLPGYVAYYDADTRLRLGNRAYVERFVHQGRDPIGLPLREIVGESVFGNVEPRVREVLQGLAPDHEQEVTTATGDVRYMRVGFRPHVAEGRVVGFLVCGVDATQEQAAQERLEERVREHTTALEASEQRFAKAFRSSPAALAIRRLGDDRILDVNDRYVEITGYARDDVVGKTSVEVGIETREPVAHRERALRELHARGGCITNIEMPFTSKSGQARIALVSLEELDFGVEGPCVLSTFIDITERKRGERRLAAQDAVSRLLAESSSLAAAAHSLLEVLGRAEDWAVGAIWTPVAPLRLACLEVWTAGEDAIELAMRTRGLTLALGEGVPGRVWATGEPLFVEDVRADGNFVRGAEAARAGMVTAIGFPIRHGDEVLGVVDFLGRPRELDPQLQALLAGIGRQLGVFVQRTRAVEAIRVSEERLQTVIENLSEGLVLANASGRVVHWNPAARALHGLATDEDWNRTLAELPRYFELSSLDGTILPVDEWPLARILRNETVRDCELRVRRLDVEWLRVFSYRGSLVPQPDGSVLAVLTINDITERMRRDELRRQSEELAAENRRVQEASRLKDEFLANMSHELRTPLNAIIGFTSLIHAGKVGAVTDVQKEYLGDVLSSGNHLLQVINDILDLAKVEAGRVEVSAEELDLAELIQEVRDIVRGLTPEKGIPFRIEIAPELSRIRADPRILKQILYNYVSNALKFTHAGEITVRAALEAEGQDAYRIDVVDTGIGIREEDLPRLFVAFQQLDVSPGKKYQGTGLGLALTRKLAEAHGGSAGAVSTLGHGSRFFVVLPRMASD